MSFAQLTGRESLVILKTVYPHSPATVPSNIKYEAISSSAEIDKDTGLISDKLVILIGYKFSKSCLETFRLVSYEDYATSIVTHL